MAQSEIIAVVRELADRIRLLEIRVSALERQAEATSQGISLVVPVAS